MLIFYWEFWDSPHLNLNKDIMAQKYRHSQPLAPPVLWHLGNKNGGEEASSHWTNGWAQSAVTADGDGDLQDWKIDEVSINL